MSSTQDRAPPPLPPDFKTIEEINNMPSDLVRANTMVNVIGFIKDFQPPIVTRGSDHKCTLEILDRSVRYETHGLKIIIFWPLQSMPATPGPSDIILIRKAKVQMWAGSISLMANKASEFHVLPLKKIPAALTAAARAPWLSYRYDAAKGKVPDETETRYVIWASSHANEMELPSVQEFKDKTKQAMSLRDKFSLLKDVQPDKFYNLLGQVIRVYELGGILTLYLSDYTANSKFYNYVWGEDPGAAGRDGDEYGYTKFKNKEAKSWPGPFGKLTIQLTLYDGHADFVRENVKVDDWVFLSNVQIKYGKMGGLLEGFLRGDQIRFEDKIQVKIMEQAEDAADNDERWKEAIRRKAELLIKFKKQRQDMLDDAAGVGSKRKNGGDARNYNSKKRRQEKRALAAKRAAESEANLAEKVDLNESIRCTFPDQPIVSLKEILKPQILLREDKSENNPSSFTVCKYRANVRIVDYFPHRIEDFAVGRTPSEMDILSDYSGGEDTDLEEDLRTFRSGKGFSKKVWEWRFALQVEDASSKDSQERLWLMVNNHQAQGLLGLEDDASNLRGNQHLLVNLKQQLFKLWGDLEERKSATLSKQPTKENKGPPPSSFQSSASSPPRKAGEQPDLDSDDEIEDTRFTSNKSSVLEERDINVPLTINRIAAGLKSDMSLALRKKAFTCCINQYGVKVKEDDPVKANAGDGLRWQRVFGLFGTQIM